MFVATYYPRNRKIGPLRTWSTYPTRDEAAMALFRLCKKAETCQTTRGAEIDGRIIDTGSDIWFHDRRNYPAA